MRPEVKHNNVHQMHSAILLISMGLGFLLLLTGIATLGYLLMRSYAASPVQAPATSPLSASATKPNFTQPIEIKIVNSASTTKPISTQPVKRKFETDTAIFEYFKATVSQSQVQLLGIALSGDIPSLPNQGLYRRYFVSVRGSFDQLLKFVNDVEASDLALRILDVTLIAPKPKLDDFKVEFQLEINPRTLGTSPNAEYGRALQDIAKIAPLISENLWLTSIATRPGMWEINGQASIQSSVIELQERLLAQKHFANPQILVLQQDRSNAWRFRIQFVINPG